MACSNTGRGPSYLLGLFLLVCLADATHYRFGTISHKPGTQTGEVIFTIKLAFRRSFTSSWSAAVGTSVRSSGRWKLGDGTSTSNPPLTITAFSAEHDWVFLEGTHSHVYADTSRTYYADFESCCRLSELLNNRNGNYITRTKVTFPSGRSNESPVSNGLPIVEVLQGTSGRFTIPFEDTDNDPVNCTQANPVNTLGYSSSNAYPSWVSVDNTGTVRYDTSIAQVGLWNYAVELTDAHSYIHLDFLIKVTERKSFCDCPQAASTQCNQATDCSACGSQSSNCAVNLAPAIISPSPVEGSTVTVSQGSQMSLTFYALDSNEQDTVSILMSSAPTGAAMSSTSMNTTTRVGTATVTWPIPMGSSSYYVQIFCVWAQDSHGLQSTQYCVNVLVDPVTTVPDVPQAPYLVKATGQSLKVAWTSPNITDTRTVNGFNLYMDGQQMAATLTETMFKIGTTMEHTASYLRPMSQHRFTLALCNRLGCSAQSTPGVFTTIGAPFNPPAVPELVTRDERSITVRWAQPYIPPGRSLTAFQLTRQPLNGAAVVVTLGAGVTEYQSSTLEPSSTHTFTVAACETLQCGRESEPGVYDTLDGFSSLCESECPPKNKALRDRLLTHWGFDEGNGTYASSSVPGAPRVEFNGNVLWKSGEHGKAAQVSASAYLTAQHGAGNRTLDVGREFTLCFWRRLHAGMIGGGGGIALLTKGGYSNNASISPFHVVENFPGKVELIISDGTTKLSGAIVTVPYQLDTWRHICYVRDRGDPLTTTSACLQENTQYNGTVMNTTSPVSSAKLCQEQCNQQSGCVAFTWAQSGFSCSLLASNNTANQTLGVTSGPSRCPATIVGFLDGAQHFASPDPTVDSVNNNDPMYFGKAVWSGEQSLIGRIDEVLIYNAALTPVQVAAVYTACLPSSIAPLECPQCPLNTTEPWPLMENFQTGGPDPIGCRECCATQCDDLCFAKGSNPGRCMGSSPLEAYMRCMGTGYVQANCTGNSTLSGCLFSGVVRRCPMDCALQGASAGTYGKCDTWTGKCTFPVECDPGYTQVGALCLDTNECLSGQYGAALCASRNAECINTVGSYTCSCLPGYEGNASISTCTNVNECNKGANPCVSQAVCSDAVGGYACTCNPGFVGDGRVNGTGCVDIDECVTGTHTCSRSAQCDNGPGNFSCSCQPGFVGNGYSNTSTTFGTGCADVDECASGSHACGPNALCENEIGHYDCSCLPGYVGTGTHHDPCVDVNECLSINSCTANSQCINLPGNYSCECNPGFTGDGMSGTCSRCTSAGTGEAPQFDGVNDQIALKTAAGSVLQLGSSAGFTAQVWFFRQGTASHQTSYSYDQSFEYGVSGAQITTGSAGTIQFDPIVGHAYNGSSTTGASYNSYGSNIKCFESATGTSPNLVFSHVGPKTLAECAALCSANANCTHFSLAGAAAQQDAGKCVGCSAAPTMNATGYESYTYVRSGTVSTQGLSFFLGLQGSNLVTGVTLQHGSSQQRYIIKSTATVKDNRWIRASVTYDVTSSRLKLYLDTLTAASASLGQTGKLLYEPNPTLHLGGNPLGQGAFKGRIREARFWSSLRTSTDITNSDCQSGNPTLRFHWAPATSASNNDGCPLGEYCRNWLSPATCDVSQHITCGTAAATSTTSNTGSLANTEWSLLNGLATTIVDDWPIQMYDGASYWHQLPYSGNIGPCTDSPSCNMALDKILNRPTPPFRYVAGLIQSHSGTTCSATAVARVLLNYHECARTNSSSTSASSYSALDTWDCQNFFIGLGVQNFQQMSQAAAVTCTIPSSGPALLLGSSDSYVYVQN